MAPAGDVRPDEGALFAGEDAPRCGGSAVFADVKTEDRELADAAGAVGRRPRSSCPRRPRRGGLRQHARVRASSTKPHETRAGYDACRERIATSRGCLGVTGPPQSLTPLRKPVTNELADPGWTVLSRALDAGSARTLGALPRDSARTSAPRAPPLVTFGSRVWRLVHLGENGYSFWQA